MKDRLMSTSEVAQILGVSHATIKRWTDDGTLPCFRSPGGHRKFRDRDIREFVSRGRANPVPKGE